MSATAPGEPDTPRPPSPPAAGWRVRAASRDDVDAVAAAVGELLRELDGTPPRAAAMRDTARMLLDDDRDDSDRAGALFVADAAGEIVGLLAASWQIAIHVPGRYALIQDLWVHPAWRGRSIGRELLAALFALAREQRVARVEVGLPDGRFPHLRATERFYLANGFASIGARARLLLP